MHTAKAFLRDLSQLPKYRRQLKQAGSLWADQFQMVEYAPSYRGTWGQMRQRRMLCALPQSELKGWVVYLHGGAWTFGKPDDFIAVASTILPTGYGLIMPTYRRLPRYHCGDMLADFRLALVECTRLGWVSSRHTRTIVGGMSSGGHLAAIAGLSPQIWEDAGWSIPQKVLCCGAPLDTDMMPNYPGMQLLNRGNTEINPKRILASANHIPQFMLLHPTDDGMAPANQARSFFDALKEKSPNSCVHWLKGSGHLEAGRWMFQDNEIRRRIQQFITVG